MNEAPERIILPPEEPVAERMVEDDPPEPSAPAAGPPTPTPVTPVGPRSYFDLSPEARAAVWTPEGVKYLMDRWSGPPPRTRWHLERPPWVRRRF